MDDHEVMEVRLDTLQGVLRLIIPDPERLNAAEIGRRALAVCYLVAPRVIGGQSQTHLARSCGVKKQCIQKIVAKLSSETGIKVSRQHQSTTADDNADFRHDGPPMVAPGDGWAYGD